MVINLDETVFARSTRPRPWQKFLVTQMPQRDLFATANLFVLSGFFFVNFFAWFSAVEKMTILIHVYDIHIIHMWKIANILRTIYV